MWIFDVDVHFLTAELFVCQMVLGLPTVAVIWEFVRGLKKRVKGDMFLIFVTDSNFLNLERRPTACLNVDARKSLLGLL